MPKTIAKAGVTGTAHHCPGDSIPKYQRMGNCRKNKTYGYCQTHQKMCEKGCNQHHLILENCPGCEARAAVRLDHCVHEA